MFSYSFFLFIGIGYFILYLMWYYPFLFQWREPLGNLLELARRDADDWIETVADMYRDYPNRQCITPILTNTDSFFCKSLDELKKMGEHLAFIRYRFWNHSFCFKCTVAFHL